MGMYKYVRKSFAASMKKRSDAFKERVRKWRGGRTIVRADSPSNPVRAHELGYKATKDFVVARVRISHGKRRRRQADLGRKPAKNRKFVEPGRELKWFAEQKASRRFSNLDVVNSYLAGSDGQYKYFEVILHNPCDDTPYKALAKKPVAEKAVAKTGFARNAAKATKAAAATAKAASAAKAAKPAEKPARKA